MAAGFCPKPPKFPNPVDVAPVLPNPVVVAPAFPKPVLVVLVPKPPKLGAALVAVDVAAPKPPNDSPPVAG